MKNNQTAKTQKQKIKPSQVQSPESTLGKLSELSISELDKVSGGLGYGSWW